MDNFSIKWILMDMTFGFELWTFDLTNVQSIKFDVIQNICVVIRYWYFQISLDGKRLLFVNSFENIIYLVNYM